MEREGIIRNVLASREKMPKYDTKNHFRVKWNFPESSSKVEYLGKLYGSYMKWLR